MPTERENLNLQLKNANETALRLVRKINEFNALLPGLTGHTKESIELDLVDLYHQQYVVNKKIDETYDAIIALNHARPSLIKRIFRRK